MNKLFIGFMILGSFNVYAQKIDWTRDAEANNCYNFAVGKKTDSFAIPGRSISPHKVIYDYSCEELIKGAEDDGLDFIEKNKNCNAKERLIALVVAPGKDFHWYYYDQVDKTWWGKQGAGLPTNKDFNKKTITSVEKASRGIYKFICGYFCVDKKKVSIW